MIWNCLNDFKKFSPIQIVCVCKRGTRWISLPVWGVVGGETCKRKPDMSLNFKYCRIRSNFYLKFNKHEKKWWRVLSSNLSNSGLFIRTNKYHQIKRDRHEKMKIWWNFQFNYWKLEVLCIKSPKEFHKILAHKFHQAPTEFFSETLRKSVAFMFTRNGQIGLFRKDSPTKAERERNYLTDVCKILITISSLSLSKFYKHP